MRVTGLKHRNRYSNSACGVKRNIFEKRENVW